MAAIAAAVMMTGLLVPQSARAATSVTVQGAVARILADTNALRAAGGLSPLVESTAIDTVAQNWAAQMYANGAMTHNPNYSGQIPSGWTNAAENIAMGYSYTTVVEAWHQSPGHYANIMGPYTSIGIGYYQQGGATYFVQDFGGYPGAQPSSAPLANSPTLDFVLASYTDVLNRTPSSSDSGVRYWTSAIAAGAPRSSVASSFNNSDEYRNLKITAAYSDVLGRAPDAGGAAYWLSLMQAGIMQPDDTHRTFLSADEFYSVQGQGTDAGYVSALYRDVIGRAPDAAGLSYWVGVLQSSGRGAVVDGLWYATETFNVRVVQAFQTFLGRSPSSSELSYWAGVARSAGLTGLRSALMSTDEYWVRASSRF